MYVALGGGANHLTDAVDRLSRVFANGGGTGDAADGGGAPSAMRGYDGLLKDLPSGGGGTSDKPQRNQQKARLNKTSERTVGAALRGRPWFGNVFAKLEIIVS